MLNIIIQVISAGIVTFGFGLLFNIEGKNLIHTSVAGCLSWLCYLLCKKAGLAEEMAYFLASVIIGLYSEIIAMQLEVPSNNILIAALIPLAPGGGVYYTMQNLIYKNYLASFQNGIQTFLLAGSMALGVITAIAMLKFYKYMKVWRING
ncbi:MAG: threonine/serine exporter family protein [Fusobacterium sp. JB021]|nr:threonine/serine exporter family protein [Fusobacterium sp. JB021]MDP0505765.1 threonine/serine exporter family protein [Fusobacterium sp. JB019]